jgi:ribosome-associated protein
MSSPIDADFLENLAPERPSKSQRKRQASALQTLGEELVDLNSQQLQHIALPDIIKEAIRETKNITQRGARKRQLQLIGKLMRQVDPDPIRAALERLEAGTVTTPPRIGYLENLCGDLIAGDEAKLNKLFQRHPFTDRQHLLQLLRNAVREQHGGKAPKARRALLRYLAELDSDQP